MEPSVEIWLGDDRLDSQHQVLFGLIRDLENATRLRDARPVVVDCFQRLLSYMAVHFAAEERRMAEAHYKDIENHRREHETALNTARRLGKKFSQEQHEAESEAAREAVSFLRSWSRVHIPGADAKLVSFFNAQQH